MRDGIKHIVIMKKYKMTFAKNINNKYTTNTIYICKDWLMIKKKLPYTCEYFEMLLSTMSRHD